MYPRRFVVLLRHPSLRRSTTMVSFIASGSYGPVNAPPVNPSRHSSAYPCFDARLSSDPARMRMGSCSAARCTVEIPWPCLPIM